MAERVTAHLLCRTCGDEQPHELTYVGRLLLSSRCTHCGTVIRHDQEDFSASYLRDLEHRLVTKPRRLARRARKHLWLSVKSLPAALARQPRKLFTEFRTVLAERRKSR